MAQHNSALARALSPLDRDKYCCCICLDLLQNPVAIPCGHSYCLGCITDYWNTEDVRGVYSCPQCRQTFTPRPATVKNTVLADLMEDLNRTQLQDAPPAHCYAGLEDVGCDICTGRKKKALKSCLCCLASFCEDHLQNHYDIAGLRTHELVEPTAGIQAKVCSRHNKVRNMFCYQDRQSVCCLCVRDEHSGHFTASVKEARDKRQKDLSAYQRDSQTSIQKIQEDLNVLQQEMDSINQTANEALTGIDEIFTEMIHPLENQMVEVKEKIRTKQKATVGRLYDLQKERQLEIALMNSTVGDLDRLSQTQSDIYFLENYPQNLHLKEYTGLPTRDAQPMQYLKNVTVSLAKMPDKLEVFLKDNISNISQEVAQGDVLQTEPKTREDFLQYSCEMSFDPNTKTQSLSLSEGNRRVMFSELDQQKMMQGTCLSKWNLNGRQYWEVKWTGRGCVNIALGYKDSLWDQYGLGDVDKSWILQMKKPGDQVKFMHNKIISKIPGPCPSRVGVYLNHRAGILCFYNISDTMALLHKVQTTFTKPLYAGVSLVDLPGASAEFCYPLQI